MVSTTIATLKVVFLLLLLLIVAATFAIPTMATIAESDSTLTICITMTTRSPGGIIAHEVLVSLSTVDGTGDLRNLNLAGLKISSLYIIIPL